MKKIIFVGGIHGVGKTFMCKKMSIDLNINHYSASKLISKMTNEDFSTNKKVDRINENQELLIQSIIKNTVDDELFLLGGHFILLHKNGEISKVPYMTFKVMQPKAIIILIDSAERIAERLFQRDSKTYDQQFL
ncbi:ATP-binding protein [Paenibacillus thiaminolyticus]|uniref:ATP-binding protein n=1 Tax=Paenibacillus thiaminolyticus TaxID=49283 RepID=UPI003D2B7103